MPGLGKDVWLRLFAAVSPSGTWVQLTENKDRETREQRLVAAVLLFRSLHRAGRLNAVGGMDETRLTESETCLHP